MAFGIPGIAAPTPAQAVLAPQGNAVAAATPDGAPPAAPGDRITRIDPPEQTSYRDAVARLRAERATTSASASLMEVVHFTRGVGAGAADGLTDAVQGAAALVEGGFRLVTSAVARGQALSATVDAAHEASAVARGVRNNPAEAAGQIAEAAIGVWNRAAAAYRTAATAGHAADFLGKAVGQAAVIAGTAIVPGGTVADAAAASRVAQVAAGALEGEYLVATAEHAETLVTHGAADAGGTREFSTAYRVEGAGNQRLVIGENGSVSIPTVATKSGAERNLYLNFGDEARAKQFLQQRLRSFPDNAIKQFDVPTSFVDELRATAVPEAERSLHLTRPVIADPTKAADQFGLSGPQIERLRGVIVPGSGKFYGG